MNDLSILVIGDATVVYGFGLVGIEGRIVHSREEADAALTDALATHQTGIVLISAQWAQEIRARVDALKATSLQPLVLELPQGAAAKGKQSDLRTLLRQTLGLSLDRG